MANLFQEFETLGIFSHLFSFLLVLFIVYALLQKSKLIGENKSLHAIIAFAIAMIVALSKPVVMIINNMTPWFVILMFFIIFLLIVVKIFGYEDETIMNTVAEREYIITAIVILGIIITVGAFASVFGQGLLSGGDDAGSAGVGDSAGTGDTTVTEGNTDSGSFEENVWSTLFHPKILGLVVILLISMFALKFLTDEGEFIKVK